VGFFPLFLELYIAMLNTGFFYFRSNIITMPTRSVASLLSAQGSSVTLGPNPQAAFAVCGFFARNSAI
jgi:hypothetical protein